MALRDVRGIPPVHATGQDLRDHRAHNDGEDHVRDRDRAEVILDGRPLTINKYLAQARNFLQFGLCAS